jgi:hypothetical protein
MEGTAEPELSALKLFEPELSALELLFSAPNARLRERSAITTIGRILFIRDFSLA